MDVLETLKFVSDKPIVVGLAMLGAFFTMLPHLFAKSAGEERKLARDCENTHTEDHPAWIKIVNKFGYGLMGLSVFLFIIAGFVVDL